LEHAQTSPPIWSTVAHVAPACVSASHIVLHGSWRHLGTTGETLVICTRPNHAARSSTTMRRETMRGPTEGARDQGGGLEGCVSQLAVRGFWCSEAERIAETKGESASACLPSIQDHQLNQFEGTEPSRTCVRMCAR
jgi:hypothetical protein